VFMGVGIELRKAQRAQLAVRRREELPWARQ
jgi:hypothetical protein